MADIPPAGVRSREELSGLGSSSYIIPSMADIPTAGLRSREKLSVLGTHQMQYHFSSMANIPAVGLQSGPNFKQQFS